MLFNGHILSWVLSSLLPVTINGASLNLNKLSHYGKAILVLSQALI